MHESTAHFFLFIVQRSIIQFVYYSGFSILIFYCLFFFFFAFPVFIITCSKEETWSFKMQTSLTLLHTSTSHKITNKGKEDHSQMTIIHSPSMDNWKLAALYQLILNQFILIREAHTLAISKWEMKLQSKNP